jgi:polyferredoxin
MCPYARFQSAMFDKDTLVVTYDAARGESRGPRHKGVDHRALGLGDCIDCTLCVQVCPVGIDIRDGLQYECIGCGLCIDACNSVMDRMHYTLSRIVAGGRIENIYRVQIGNATEQDQRYVLSASGIEGLRVASEAEVDVGAAQDRWVVVRLQAPYGAAGPGSHGVEITATAVGDPALAKQAHSTFLVPR